MENTMALVAALVALGLVVAAPTATAGESVHRINFTCSNLKGVPLDLRPPLADVFAPMPEGFPETEVCVSPVIAHGAHQFRVVTARSEIWCGPGGDCNTWIMGRVGMGAFAAVAPVMSLAVKKGVTLKKDTHGAEASLEIVFSEGAFRWEPNQKKFGYVLSSPGLVVELKN